MKTLVTRSLALLLTLALLFTVTPFTALAEAAENEDGMDEIMDILETYEEETEISADSGETLTNSTEETAPAEDVSGEDQPNTPEEEMIPDDTDDPGVEDDWADWYTDDQPEEESEDTWDDWPETDETLSEEDEDEEDAVQPLTLEEEIAQLYDGSYIKYAIEQTGHTYVTTKGTSTKVYETSALEDGEVICTITEKGVILLAFEYAEGWSNHSVLVWFLNDAFEAVSGYVREADLEQAVMEDADAAAWMNVLPAAYLSTTAEQFPVFVAPILLPETSEEAVAETPASDTEYPDESGEEEIDDPVLPDEQPEETEAPDIPADQPEEETDPDDPEVAVGTFLFVTTKTRVFSDMDDTLRDDANGDLYMGVFVKDAVVQVDAIRVDSAGRMWYQVAFIYGDDFVDGSMKWTEIGIAYVLPEETALTDAEDLTVTDIALPETPKASGRRSLMKAASTTPMNGFTLKSINAPIPPLYAGQTGVYGSSGHDSDYKQIASLSGKGAIYATPHYLDGYTVYCLEHNLPGPGEGSGSSQQPKGPYVIVDIDTYMNTPGSSRVIYSDQTMHAIAWVLRHTYPFMVLDRSDSDNETWSRVAGQFAIRQVIREMEGAQYVRDYWNMDNFYVASGQPPAVYLEYARWLAANGIARGNITGYINVSNKSISKVGNNYVGTATLYTDADLIRIPRSGATITGNTLGSDSSYYYLNSGDTITVTSSTNGFSITAESVNSDAEEASFLVGVPSVSIQKVLIPQYGSPYKMQSTSLYFEQEIQYGSLIVTKLRSGTQQKLAGAKLQLYDSSKNAYGSPVTTDANGQAKWTNLPYGTYYVGEVGAPAGYRVNVDQVQVTINGNNTTTFNNSPIIGSVSFVKIQRGTEIPLVGAQYELVTKSASTYKRAVSAVDGSELPVLTTDANGKATWSNVVEYGTYYVHEVKAPEGFLLDNAYHAVSVTQHNKIVSADVDDPIITAKIKIAKTDGLTKGPLAGVEFTITRLSGPTALNGAGVGEVAAVITTDANGYAETDWLDWGRFKVEETKVPAGYTDSHYSTEIEAYENWKTYTISVENEPTKGWIRIVKTDSLDDHPIAGVQFDIYQAGEIVSTMTTDADGVAVSEPLHKGKYTVREHENPTGYTVELVSLDCEVYSDQTTNLTASNTPIQFRVKIEKTDQLTREPLAGAEFTITRKSGLPSHEGENDGEVVAVLVTDSNGEAVSDLLTWGVYEVKESKVPVHFVDNHFSATITGSEDNKTYTITCENEPTKGYIKIVKTDKLDRTPIEGVQFDIYENDAYGSGLAATMTTDKNGVAVSPALRKGTYIVKEHADPTGYTTDLVELDCVVKSDETTNLSCTNTPIQGKIRIIKTDELTSEALAGAEFTITRVSGLPSHKGSNDGEVAAVIVTDADGIAVSPLLTWGVYHVEETSVPLHYVDNHFSTEVTIDTEDLMTYDVPCENEPTKGWIRLTKTDRKNCNPISGVQFDIYYNDQYGEGLAATMVTDENGIAMSEPIRKGRYIVKEHGETAGYVFEEVTLNCTVKSDEITDLSATNQPVQVRLKLYKRDVDEYAGNPAADPVTRGDGMLTGAVFQVLAGENIMDRQGNILYEKGAVIVGSLKTASEDASVTTEELWPGVYEIVELTPPTGYQPTDKHILVDATSAARQSQEAVITYDGVVCNEILYGCYAFVKFTGDNEIHDDAGLIETPEPGAVFQVYLKKAGSFDAARAFERDTITTDENGKTQTKLLPYGIYTVRQTKAKEGYAIKAPFDIFIRGTEKPDNPPSMILNNEAIRYRLKFIKVDSETGKTITLANTAFKLKDANGEYITQTVHYPRTQVIDTFKTDADGTVTLPETVRYGLYFIEEFAAPEGYLIQTEELAVFVGDENMNQPGEAYLLEFEIENTPVKGQIRLKKTGLQLTGFKEKEDRYGNTVMQPIYEEKRLAGSVFEVRAAETITGKDGTVWYEQDALVDTITTTADGPDVSKTLPLGRYYLVEVSAPDGYSFDDRHYEADLIYADEHTPLVETVVTAGNDYLPAEISLTKEKEILQIVQEGDAIRQIITTVPGEGFTFGLYNDTDIHYDGGTLMADTLLSVGVTDAEGKLTFSGNFPHGRYFIKELSASAGWKINTERFTVTLDPAAADEDHVIRVTLPDAVHDELIWYPVTLTKLDITGEKTLPGALIEVSNEKGEVIYRTYTDKNGQIPNIPVTPGTYTFREILAPSGYALNEAVMSFTVDADGGITGDTTIRDDYTRVLLLKQDENGLPLAGVEFALTKSNGTVLMRKTSDADGRIAFEKIPCGEYTITETKALAGYQRHDVSIRLTVDGTFVNQTEPLETIINHPIIVKLKKVDQDGKSLPGAEYALINEYGEQMMTAVSDADGMLTFYKVPYGKYTVKELYAPDGYLLSKGTPEIVIDDSWQNSDSPVLTLTNHLKRLRYIKVDTNGKYLPGVEFSLINASNGEVVEVVTSNEKGEFIFTKFDYGFWLIRETKVPDGFNQMKDITFSVDASWVEPAPFTCVNIPNHYEFVKTDNEGNPIAGVTFTLEDQEGNILRDLVSGEDGIVQVDGLTPGTYIIREIETLEGYTVSGEAIELVIDEHYIVPDEMYVLVNYPDIQTGVDFEITPWMYAGGAAMLAGLILLLAVLFRRLKK